MAGAESRREGERAVFRGREGAGDGEKGTWGLLRLQSGVRLNTGSCNQSDCWRRPLLLLPSFQRPAGNTQPLASRKDWVSGRKADGDEFVFLEE